MGIVYNANKKLPPLAWLAECNNGNIKVSHGEKVETKNDFWAEGAWNGAFSQGDFETADWFCGTGGKCVGDKICFSTPSHINYGLYLVEKEEKVFVSNSLYFLLTECDYKLDVNYLKYETDFLTITQGIHKYNENIRVLNKNGEKEEVKVFYFRNIVVNFKNQYSVSVKPKVQDFKSFDNYYSRLTSAMQEFAANVRCEMREYSYDFVSTVSKGYDAACCSAIAKQIGCNKAVTFKDEGHHKDDSGKEIAQKLGYEEIIERDSEAYAARTDFVEAEYVSTGELGSTITLCAFDEDFKNNVVITGTYGDVFWDCECVHRNNEFHVKDVTSQLGLAEKRLWLGSIICPIASFGGSAWESIYDISLSEEMEKWRLHNYYDRPIPRRILEESGVPRNMFGMNKHGAGFVYRYDSLSRIKKRMSKTSARRFSEYVRKNKNYKIGEICHYIKEIKPVYVLRLCNMFRLNKLKKKIKILDAEALSKISNPLSPRYLIPWAAEIMMEKYKTAIN